MKQYFKFIYIILFFALCMSDLIYGQSFVAMTIDDIPRTGKTLMENYKSKLLNVLDSFTNEMK